jgi:hypothetical protein
MDPLQWYKALIVFPPKKESSIGRFRQRVVRKKRISELCKNYRAVTHNSLAKAGDT